MKLLEQLATGAALIAGTLVALLVALYAAHLVTRRVRHWKSGLGDPPPDVLSMKLGPVEVALAVKSAVKMAQNQQTQIEQLRHQLAKLEVKVISLEQESLPARKTGV